MTLSWRNFLSASFSLGRWIDCQTSWDNIYWASSNIRWLFAALLGNLREYRRSAFLFLQSLVLMNSSSFWPSCLIMIQIWFWLQQWCYQTKHHQCNVRFKSAFEKCSVFHLLARVFRKHKAKWYFAELDFFRCSLQLMKTIFRSGSRFSFTVMRFCKKKFLQNAPRL